MSKSFTFEQLFDFGGQAIGMQLNKEPWNIGLFIKGNHLIECGFRDRLRDAQTDNAVKNKCVHTWHNRKAA